MFWFQLVEPDQNFASSRSWLRGCLRPCWHRRWLRPECLCRAGAGGRLLVGRYTSFPPSIPFSSHPGFPGCVRELTYEPGRCCRLVVQGQCIEIVDHCAGHDHAIADSRRLAYVLGRRNAEANGKWDLHLLADPGDIRPEIVGEARARAGDASDRDAIDEAAGTFGDLGDSLDRCWWARPCRSGRPRLPPAASEHRRFPRSAGRER